MSKYDKERETMGIAPVASSAPSTNTKSKYAAERETLRTPLVIDFSDDVSKPAQSVKPVQQEPSTSSKPKLPGRDLPIIGPVLRGLDYVASNPVSEAIAEYTVPDQPYIGQPGTNVRQDFLQKSGQEAAAGVPKFIGAAAAPFFVPGSELGAGNQIFSATANALKQAPQIGKVGSAAVQGMVGGAAANFGAEFAQGQGDIENATRAGSMGAALGATGGAALPLIGRGIQSARNAASRGFENGALKSPGNVVDQSVTQDVIHPLENRVKPVEGQVRGNPSDDYVAAAQEDYELPNTMSHIATKTKRQIGGVDQLKSSTITNAIDDLYRIKQFDQVAEDVLKRKLNPSESTYTLALNSRGADMIANQSVLNKLVDSQGNVVGDSLKDVMNTVPRKQFGEFEDYLINKHAITRMERGEKVFPDHMMMTPEKSAVKVAEYEAKYPQFKESAQKYYDYQDNLAKSWLVDTGLITEKQFAKWKEANPNYVPNQRLFETIEAKGPNRAKGGFLGQKNPVKGYAPGGSQRKIISPVESTIENTDKYIKTAKRNEVGQALLNLLEKGGDDLSAFARIVPDEAPINPYKILNEEGIDGLMAKLGDDWQTALEAAKKDPNRTASVTVMRNGKPVKIEISDLPLFEAMTALSPPQQNILLRWAAQATRMFKMLTTGYNPIFSLTRNVIRDVPQAFVNSKTTDNPVRFAADLVDSFLQILGNKEVYQSFKNFGGGHSSSVASNRNLLAQSKRRVLPGNRIKGAVPKLFEGLENLNNAIESAPRLAEYKRTLKRGGGDYDSRIQGLFNANDVTVNFNKRGKFTREAEAIFPYLNASVQSLDKLARVYKDNPGKAAMKSILAITFPAMYLYSLNHDNPNYQKVSNRDKDIYYLIPREDGTFYKLPKPQGAGVPFGSLIERVLRQWNDQDPQAFKDFASTLKTNFTPPGVGAVFNNSPIKALEEVGRDTIGGPIVGVASNKDFADRPIVPGTLQGLSPANQFDERTSEVSKFVGKYTNSSPKQLDYLAKSYTGVIGQVGIPLTTKSGSLGDTLVRQVTTDPLYSNDIMRDFYDQKTKLDTAEKDYKATGEKGKNYDNALRLKFNRVADDISEWNKAIRKIQSNKLLTPEQQELQIRAYKEKINDAATKLNEAALQKK